MNHLLPSSPALLVSMATIRKGMKAKQVTTHTHDSVPIGAYRQFKDVGQGPQADQGGKNRNPQNDLPGHS